MADWKDMQKAINYIATTRNGEESSLIDKIGKDLYKQFCYTGLIKKGVSVKADQKYASTWHITELGERQNKFYREPDAEESQLGELYFSLGI